MDFCKSLEIMDNAKLRQISMYGPLTNWKFLDLLNKARADQQLPKLVNIAYLHCKYIVHLRWFLTSRQGNETCVERFIPVSS